MAMDRFDVLNAFEYYRGFYFGQPTQHDYAIIKHNALGYLADATDPACVFGPLEMEQLHR
jgi:hypothetical protein